MKEKIQKIEFPKMDLTKLKVFWICSLGILAGTLIFNILGIIPVISSMFQAIANVFFVMFWVDIVLAILVIFSCANRENETGQVLIFVNYVLCALLFLIPIYMGLNLLLLGVVPHTGFLESSASIEFSLFQIGQIAWMYVLLGCFLGLAGYSFFATTKDEDIWNL